MRLILLVAILAASTIANAQPELHHRINVDLSTTSMDILIGCDVELDHGVLRPQKSYVNDMPISTIACLDAGGADYRIAIHDVATFYADRASKERDIPLGHASTLASFDQLCLSNLPNYTTYETPSNYRFGDMGGYLTYDEALENLALMSTLYPELISPAMEIGDIRTHEGLPVYYYRLSDNPTTDEIGEPEVLYTSLHHSREPNSLAQNLYYMWYLLENYDSDPEVKAIVENTELYFVPIINPDGYVYNQEIMPNGGGLWRKNRATINGQQTGVDLNRNYGFQWGIDNQGSSPDPQSEVYRGPGPFSEPETQAMQLLCQQQNFRVALNYHTFGNILIFPWAYSDQPTPDDDIYQALGKAFTADNRYVYGVGSEVLGYTVNGDSDDYMYAEETGKLPIITMTPEVGQASDGFWPDPERIDILNKQSMLANLRLAHSTHNLTVATPTVDVYYPAGVDFSIPIEVKRYGFNNEAVGVDVQFLDPSVNAGLFTVVSLDQTDQRTIDLDVPGLAEGSYAATISVEMNHYTAVDTISIHIIDEGRIGGTEVVADVDFTDWSVPSDWSLTSEDFVSGPTSLTDSPGGDYDDRRTYEVTLLEQVDLSAYLEPSLSMMLKYDIEDDYDYAQLQISGNDGESWEALCGDLTQEGSPNQTPELPLYDGTADWAMETIDLSAYSNYGIVDIRMVLVTDANVRGDGMYIDDMVLTGKTTLSTATSDITQSPAYYLYPNPVEDRVYLAHGSESSIVSCQVINSLGQRMPVVLDDKSIDMSTLVPGLYSVALELDDGSSHRQLIIKQ
jgi:hypothetical protein